MVTGKPSRGRGGGEGSGEGAMVLSKSAMCHGGCCRPQRSCGKVMFSQACVKNSVRGRGLSTTVHAGIHTPWQTPPPDRQTPPPDRHTSPPPAATVADGTYPTGMHSCLDCFVLRTMVGRTAFNF